MAEAPTAGHDALETEREFLLRSLDDLEAERAAGNIDDESYEQLRDDYTARAAAVIRALHDGGGVAPTVAPMSWRRRLLTAGGIVGFAVVAALLLASALGARLPGRTATGNNQAVSQQQAGAELARAAKERPDDASAQLAYARHLDSTGKTLEALKAYDAAVKLEPGNAEALASSGWLLYRVAATSSDPVQGRELARTALDRLDRAVQADPEYPEARFFRGAVLFRAFDDAEHAVPDLQRFLILAPDAPMGSAVRTLLAEAQQALDAPSTTVPGAQSSVPSSTTSPVPTTPTSNP